VGCIFSELDSIASSDSSVDEWRSNAFSEIVSLLLGSELKTSFPMAITKLGPEKFQRNFRRLLIQYGRQLLREASNYLECQVAILVRLSAAQISVESQESFSEDALI
jgi:hypothetical protein